MRTYHIVLQVIGVLLLSLGYHFTLHPLPLPTDLELFSPLDIIPDIAANSSEILTEITCRVAVTNSKLYHHETLESIAGLLPLHYLKLPPSCNTIVFDFYICKVRGESASSYVRYFESSMRGKDVSNLTNDDSSRSIRRTIGNLNQYTANTTHQILNISLFNNVMYDAQVEASCYCTGGEINNHGDKWIQEESHRTCIFHRSCRSVANHSRAVWVSPHYQNYYIPSMLPNVSKIGDNSSTFPKPFCTIGGINRRKWDFIRSFLASGDANTSKARFHIMGRGNFPEQLKDYTNVTKKVTIAEYTKFHEAVAQCGAILPLLTKEDHKEYFNTRNKGLRKLTGQLPLILAYELPFVIHEELYELYKKHLPGVPFATHNDTLESFRDAMNEFLDKLDNWNASNEPRTNY